MTNQCTTPEATATAAHLSLIASDIEPALLAPGAHDRVFSQYASDLRDAIAAFAAAQDCPARRAAVTKIGQRVRRLPSRLQVINGTCAQAAWARLP